MKLGRYEVVRELGKGAMGIVYLAKDPLIGRLVALKTIRAAQHADDDETREFQQRFIREAQAAGILNHPSIVTVHDIGNDEGTNTSFIAMEYVEGNNLKEVLQQGRNLTFEQVADIVAQVAEALDFAHSKGIVHRDVKPANIILIDGRAKITDFGIAKIASGAANLTSTGQFLGTPNYMAPEQIKGAPVDGRTDIFALGICLYECLTRRKPFGGDSLTSISYKIVHESFPALHEINPQIPDGYQEIVAHCLEKDPTKRYQRARDMATSLRAVIRGEKPVRPPDPMLADETIITRADRDKVPTLEVPFPEAIEVDTGGNLVQPKDVGGSTRPAAKAAGAVAAAQAAPRKPRQPIALQLRTTLTNVRALPLWRRRIPPAIFAVIVGILIAGLVGAVASIRSKHAPVVKENTAEYQRREKERQLRSDAQGLLRQGRINDAYAKYEAMSRLSPRSPFVITQMARLSAIRQQEAAGKEQLAIAQTKFQEGLVLFNQKKFAESVPIFQEAFSLDPSFLEAGEYLKNAQLEDQKVQQAKLAARQRTATTTASRRDPATATSGTTATTQTQTETVAVNNTPAQLTTVFSHPFVDGQIIVKLGAETVLHTPLWEETGRGIFRRKRAKPVNVSKEVMPKNADLQIWVLVPAQKITQYHIIPAAKLGPGTAHRLTVNYNAQSKTFAYEFN